MTQALLLSNVVVANTVEQCVEFYYYKHKNSIGELNVYGKPASQDAASLDFPLWTERFECIDEQFSWQRGQVPLSSALTKSPYQVVFEAHVEPTVDHPMPFFSIYLDDVFIRDQSCLPPGDCDFENGLCEFLNKL